MTCDQAIGRIGEYADGELPAADAAALKAHLDGCPACAAELDGIARLDALLRRVPAAGAPSADFAERVAARASARRPGGWILLPPSLAAAGLLVLVLVQVLREPYGLEQAVADAGSGSREAMARAARWARTPEDRERLLAAQAESASEWELQPIGIEVSDVELVGYAIGLARSERTAPEALGILSKLDREGFNREAHAEIVRQLRGLLASGQEGEIRTAFRVLERLEMMEADVIEFLDVPDLGGRALEFLRRRTGKDFGVDKAAWRSWFESRKM